MEVVLSPYTSNITIYPNYIVKSGTNNKNILNKSSNEDPNQITGTLKWSGLVRKGYK